VTDIVPYKDGLLIVGNFSNVFAANGSTSTGGYALYNTSTSQWSNSGIVYGTAAAAAGSDSNAYFGGRIRGASRNAVNGVASLTIEDGVAQLSNLEGVAFSNQGSAPAPANLSRRSHTARWITRIHRTLVERQAAAQPASYPDEPVVAPATLAGAYYKNSSSMVTILGGNFSQGTGGSLISGVAFQSDGALSGPPNPVAGVVRALEVRNDMLFIGGSGVNVTGKGSNFLTLHLNNNSWTQWMPPTLSAGSNATVDVNAIKAQPDADIVIVGGNFAQVGDLPCPAVCQWNVPKGQWSRVGNNAPSAGEVKSLAFGGEKSDVLLAGGSFVIGGKNVYAARYTFNESGTNGAWEPLGELPGPVQSIAVNDRNASDIFAAGFDASTSKPYLQHWNGVTWTEQNSSLLMDGTSIENLAFVPLSKKHEARGVIQDNRMLMATGNVFLSGQGNSSSALYDGQQWFPYLVGSSPTGELGAGSSLFWSESNFSFTLGRYLARGLVVLVAMAIATGLILLIVLLILLVAFCFRRQDRKRRPAQEMYEKDEARSEVSSTHNLIHSHVQTALEQSFAPAQYAPGQHPGVAMAAAGAAGVGAGAYAHHRSAESSDSHYLDAGEYSQAPLESEEYGAAGSWEGSDEGRETVMRYDFCGPELQSGELSMKAGQRVIILDDEQSEEWWYARDPATGRQGVVPATYVL
jgi:cbb3-type cytochrome oxidase subunit 3